MEHKSILASHYLRLHQYYKDRGYDDFAQTLIATSSSMIGLQSIRPNIKLTKKSAEDHLNQEIGINYKGVSSELDNEQKMAKNDDSEVEVDPHFAQKVKEIKKEMLNDAGSTKEVFKYKDAFYDDYVGRLASKFCVKDGDNVPKSYIIDQQLKEQYPFTEQMIQNMKFRGVKLYKHPRGKTAVEALEKKLRNGKTKEEKNDTLPKQNEHIHATLKLNQKLSEDEKELILQKVSEKFKVDKSKLKMDEQGDVYLQKWQINLVTELEKVAFLTSMQTVTKFLIFLP